MCAAMGLGQTATFTSAAMRSARVALLVSTLVACSSAPPVVTPGMSPGVPGTSPVASASGSSQASGAPPPSVENSSQALIAADLAAGKIDSGTALELRAWALFGDPRLPQQYDGSGSNGEDESLLNDIAGSLDTLPDGQRAELERYLLRPTDPGSPFSGPTSATVSNRALGQGIKLAGAITADDSVVQLCSAPRSWFSKDWSPDGSADVGFRVWACGVSQATVQGDLDTVIGIASSLWTPMTLSEPDGMGRPVPDNAAKQNDGNGKIDVYLLEPLAQCRIRGDSCQAITGDALAVAPKDWPENCTVVGFPDNGCSGYMLLDRGRISAPEFAADFAHEFFHILQLAHNGRIDITWYHEASAVWAEWFYEREASKPYGYSLFQLHQEDGRSLLWYDYGRDFQYEAWDWPLFQFTVKGSSNVFQTWAAIESATTKSEVDFAVDGKLSFTDKFRDYAVRNAQPAAYIPGASTGLESERWQSEPTLSDFPANPHFVTGRLSTVSLGEYHPSADVDPLAAQYDEYQVTDQSVRQIEIDITSLTGAEQADLDVLAQLGGQGDNWHRFTSNNGKLKFCRDTSGEDVQFFQVVLSNHAVARSANFPDFTKGVKGQYKIVAKNQCDPHELHFGGTITWTAQSSVTVGGQVQTQSVTGTADVVIHVIDPYLLVAERDGGSTYSYDYSNNYNCASSHEAGTLESGAGVGDTNFTDYSIGILNPGAPIGEDLALQILMPDYCGRIDGQQCRYNKAVLRGFPRLRTRR